MKRMNLMNVVVGTALAMGAIAVQAATAGSVSDPSGPEVVHTQAAVAVAADRGMAQFSAAVNAGDPSGPSTGGAEGPVTTQTGIRLAPANFDGHSAGSVSEPSGPNA